VVDLITPVAIISNPITIIIQDIITGVTGEVMGTTIMAAGDIGIKRIYT
jgi:hypothetical protein